MSPDDEVYRHPITGKVVCPCKQCKINHKKEVEESNKS
jgi:hypothetical protein